MHEGESESESEGEVVSQERRLVQERNDHHTSGTKVHHHGQLSVFTLRKDATSDTLGGNKCNPLCTLVPDVWSLFRL